MHFDSLLDAVADTRKNVVVYAPTDAGSDLAERLSTRNASIEYRTAPLGAPAGFVVVRDDEQFLGALALEDLLQYLAPPVRPPWNVDELDPSYRALYDLFDDTVFVSLDRRQLLATSREIENRAWRVGRGTLRVGFQNQRAFEHQRATYRQLAETTDLDIHVYVSAGTLDADFDPGPMTLHTEPADAVGRFWFLLFDGGGNDQQACGLVGEQRDDGTYRGLWTYDPGLVELADDSLQ